MSGLNSLTGKPLKHYAQDLTTKQRYVVIALQNDTDPDSCSVIDIDALDSDTRAELLNFVNSDECQRVPEIWSLLDKKYFMNYPKATMLNVLTKMRQIKVVKSAQVAIQLPGDKTMTPKEIIDCINKYESESKGGIGHFKLNKETTTNVINEAENKNSEEINALKKEVSSINEQVSALTSSIADLISALKAPKSE